MSVGTEMLDCELRESIDSASKTDDKIVFIFVKQNHRRNL